MIGRRAKKVLILVVVVAVVAVLLVDYSAHVADHDPYPTTEQLGSEYQPHVGEQLHVWAVVGKVSQQSYEIHTEDVSLTVARQPNDAEPGDVVQVYGTLRPDHVIVPARVIVSKRGHRAYMFAASAIAVLLTAGLFVREWRIDPRTFTIHSRGDERA